MPEEGPWKTTGQLKYRGNIETLSRWFAEPNKPPAWNVSGQLAGTAQLTQSDGVTGGQLAADVGNLLIQTPAGESFSEPTVRLTARGQYAHQGGVLQLEQMQLTSNMLTADAAGKTGPNGQQTGLEMQGHVKYDLEKLAGLLRPYLGQEILVTGVGNSPVSYQGLLASPTAGTAAASVGWQQADLYGFVIGPGELKMKLAGGMLQAEPMDLAASGGRLRLAPQLRLSPGPMELILPAGPLVQKAQISPQMLRLAIEVHRAGAGRRDGGPGRFLDRTGGLPAPAGRHDQGRSGRPVDDPLGADRSRPAGPGVGRAAGPRSPASLRRESVIPFRMVGGRIYHEGMELVFPDLTIRTRGSVGLDQSLQILAEMPIPPKWLVNQMLDSALRNQVIRLPIGGTLSKPQIDRRELERLSSQFVRTAAQNLLQDEVSRQLDRLLGPPR